MQLNFPINIVLTCKERKPGEDQLKNSVKLDMTITKKQTMKMSNPNYGAIDADNRKLS